MESNIDKVLAFTKLIQRDLKEGEDAEEVNRNVAAAQVIYKNDEFDKIIVSVGGDAQSFDKEEFEQFISAVQQLGTFAEETLAKHG